MNTLLSLLIAFQVKHEFADYPLQTSYMQKKSAKGLDWILPLAAHAGVHAVLTLAILIASGHIHLWYLAALDFAIHFTVDRVKALVSRDFEMWGLAFRAALFADQLAHFLTNLLIIHLMGYL